MSVLEHTSRIIATATAIIRPKNLRAYVSESLKDLSTAAVCSRFWRHQKESVVALSGHFADAGKALKAFVVIPTGGGKTAIFTALVDVFTRHGSVTGSNETPRTILLVPNLVLIGQTLMEFRKHHQGIDIGYRASKNIVDSEGVPYQQGVAAVTIMTYHRFMNLTESGELRPEDIDLLVMDEAHRGLSVLRQDTISEFAESTAIIAFSATPAFDDGRSLDALLGKENLVYSANPQQLRDDGVLAPMVNYILAVKIKGKLPFDHRLRQVAKRKAHVDETISFLEQHVDEATGLTLRDKVTVFYGADRSHAAMFANEFNARMAKFGKRMEVLTGEDSSFRIREVIAGVNQGRISGIANAQFLAEGFDLPKIGVVVNSPSNSVVKIVQQSGRAQRIDSDIAFDDVNQTAFILDTYFELDGVMDGYPHWYFEAMAGIEAMLVERDAVQAEDIDTTGYEACETENDLETSFGSDEDVDDDVAGEPEEAEEGTEEVLREEACEDLVEANKFAEMKAENPPSRTIVERSQFTTTKAIHAIRYLLRNRSLKDDLPEKPKKTPLSQKTEEWLSKTDILGRRHDRSDEGFFEWIESEFFSKRRRGEQGVQHILCTWTEGDRQSDPVTISMALLSNGASSAVYYHRDCLNDLLRVSGSPMRGCQPSEHWITRQEVVEAITIKEITVNAILKMALKKFKSEERFASSVEGVPVGDEFLRMRRIETKGRTYVAYHRDDIETVKRIANANYERKARGEISRHQFARMHKLSEKEPRMVAAFDRMTRQVRAGERPTVNGVWIEAAIRLSPSGGTLCISPSSMKALEDAIGVSFMQKGSDRWQYRHDLPERTDVWMTMIDVYTALRTRRRPGQPIDKLWTRLCEAEEVDGKRQVEEGAFRFKKMRSHNRPVECLHHDDLERFRKAANDPNATLSVEAVKRLRYREKGWLTKSMAANALLTSPTNPFFLKAWGFIEAARIAGHDAAFGRLVKSEIMRTRVGGTVCCLHESEVDWLKIMIGRRGTDMEPKRKGDVGRAEMAAALGVGTANERFKTAWDKLTSAVEMNSTPKGIDARHAAPAMETVVASGSVAAFAVWAGMDRVPAEKPKGYLERNEVYARISAGTGLMLAADFGRLWTSLTSMDDRSVETKSLRLVEFNVNERATAFALHPDDYGEIASRLTANAKPRKVSGVDVGEAGWIGVFRALSEMGTTEKSPRPSEFIDLLKKRLKETQWGVGNIEKIGWEDAVIDVMRATGAGLSGLAFRESDLDRITLLMDACLTPPDENWRIAGTFRARMIPEYSRDIMANIEAECLRHRRRGEIARLIRLPKLTKSEAENSDIDCLPSPMQIKADVRRCGNITQLHIHRDSWDDVERLTGVSLAHSENGNFLSREDSFKKLGTMSARVEAIMRLAASRHAVKLRLTGDDVPAYVDGYGIRCRRLVNRSIVSTCFHLDDLDLIAELGGYPLPRTDEWLDQLAAAKKFRVNNQRNEVFCRFWGDLVSKVECENQFVLNGRVLRIALRGNGGVPVACLHQDDAKYVAETLGLVTEVKTDGWLDKTEVIRAIGTSFLNVKFADTWNRMIADRDARRPVILDGVEVRFRKMASGSRAPYCLHESGLEAMAREIKAVDRNVPVKTDEWISENEFCICHRLARATSVRQVWNDMKQAIKTGQNFILTTGMPRIATMKTGKHVVTCVHRDDIPMIRGHIGMSPPVSDAEMARNWIAKKNLAENENFTDEEIEVINALWEAEIQACGQQNSSEITEAGIDIRFDVVGSRLQMRVHVDHVQDFSALVRSKTSA